MVVWEDGGGDSASYPINFSFLLHLRLWLRHKASAKGRYLQLACMALAHEAVSKVCVDYALKFLGYAIRCAEKLRFSDRASNGSAAGPTAA